MKNLKYSRTPEHGLQVEETLMAGDVDGAKHLARYWWAWTILRAKAAMANKADVYEPLNVLDLGCGCGYGTRIMSEDNAGINFWGIDADRDTLNVARRDYGHLPGIFFAEVQLSAPWHSPLVDQTYDLVTCFETLEQLKHREMMLEQLVISLRPGAVVLFSNDLSRLEVDYNPKDAFIHYSGSMFLSQLRRYFEVVIPSTGEQLANPVFEYATELNAQIRQAATSGEPLQVGRDLVYCAKPIVK